jgi:hypothetical protein
VHVKAAELQTKVAALEKDIANLTARNAGLSRLTAGPPAADDTAVSHFLHASNTFGCKETLSQQRVAGALAPVLSSEWTPDSALSNTKCVSLHCC